MMVIRPSAIADRSRCAVALFLPALLAASCQQSVPLAPVSPSLRIATDLASAPLAGDLLSAYETQLSGSLLTLDTGSRALILPALASGEIDAAILFSPLDEQGLFDTPIGYTLLQIVVPADIPVTDITRSELRAVFAGRIVSWNELGGPDIPIQPITAARGFSERLAFEHLIMGDEPITSAARITTSSRETADLVSTTTGGIGYGIYDDLPENAVTLTVDGAAPTLKDARSHRYTLISAVVFAGTQKPEGPLRSFLDWILSDAGQQVVRRHMLSLSD
ncbi:MAG: substrate-binding domain-containing protein [Anaerolineae bacterium]|nr:substrate-binding domain-containing protein [Anaerolineae bacterium]